MAKAKKDTSLTPKKITIKKVKKAKGVEYKFNTNDGFLSVGPEDIVDALKDLADHNEDHALSINPETVGWSVIHGKDSNGKMRPLFLMRSLPPCVPMPHGKYTQDDQKMAELVVKKVYHLNAVRIQWIRFKAWIVQYVSAIVSKKKGTK